MTWEQLTLDLHVEQEWVTAETITFRDGKNVVTKERVKRQPAPERRQ